MAKRKKIVRRKRSKRPTMSRTVMLRMTFQTWRLFNRIAKARSCSRSVLVRDLVYLEAIKHGWGSEVPTAKTVAEVVRIDPPDEILDNTIAGIA